MSRGTVINYAEQLVVEDCCNCGIHFAMPVELRDRCMADHSRGFYCPNGHNMSYTGKTAEDKAKDAQRAAERAAEEGKRREESLRELLKTEEERHQTSRNKLRATKAAATRARNRIEKGVCPHPSCGRHFADVQKHIASQHPDFAAAVTPEEVSA